MDGEQIVLRDNIEIGAAEARHRKGDAVRILVAALDVEGWVILARTVAGLALEQVEEPVEADGRTTIGGQIDTVHRNKSSSEQFDTRRGPALGSAPSIARRARSGRGEQQ